MTAGVSLRFEPENVYPHGELTIRPRTFKDVGFGWEKLLPYTHLEEELVDQLRPCRDLTLIVTVSTFAVTASDVFDSGKPDPRNYGFKPQESSGISIANVLQAAEFGDFAFVSGEGHKIKTSKMIMASQSPYFLNLFKHKESREVQQGELVIPEYKPRVLKKFAFFLATNRLLADCRGICLTPDNTGSCPQSLKRKLDSADDEDDRQMHDDVLDLLVLADRYDVQSLRERVEYWLARHMTEKSVVSTLFFADKCGIKELRRYAMDYLKKSRNAESLTEDIFDHENMPAELCRSILKEIWRSSFRAAEAVQVVRIKEEPVN